MSGTSSMNVSRSTPPQPPRFEVPDAAESPQPESKAQDASAQPIDPKFARQIRGAKAADAGLTDALADLKQNHDPAQEPALKAKVAGKRAEANECWGDVKAAIKQSLNQAGPGGKDARVAALKQAEKDPMFGRLVDQAAKEPPNITIRPGSNPEADESAVRVAAAYATGGDAAAAAQLRVELGAETSPGQQAAILHAARPVVDQVAMDLGMTADQKAAWGRNQPPQAPRTAEPQAGAGRAGNPNPIDSRAEYEATLDDLTDSIDMAGSPAEAEHTARMLLKGVADGKPPAADQGHPLGMLGDGLKAAAAGQPSLLSSAVATQLMKPGQAGIGLPLSLSQRSQLAGQLDSGHRWSFKVADWNDSKGHHDGTVSHEVAKNPDRYLTDAQRRSIDAEAQGARWSAAETHARKTAQGVQNLRDQYPGRNLDRVRDGERFTFTDPSAIRSAPLPPAVKAAKDAAVRQHAGDAGFGKGLEAMLKQPGFDRLGTKDQADTIRQYEATVRRGAGDGAGHKPLNAEQQKQLGALMTSPGFRGLKDNVRQQVLDDFSHYAGTEPAKLEKLFRLVNSPGFGQADSAQQAKLLDAYKQDPVFAGTVDKLCERSDLGAQDQATALEKLSRVKQRGMYSQAFDAKDAGRQERILDNVLEAVTSPQFRPLGPEQRTQVIDALVHRGGEELALQEGGAQRALDLAEQEAA